MVNHDFHATLTAPIFGLNLAMCQTVLAPVFGSNGPLWSLANEFWYYLIGPLLFVLCFAKDRLAQIACVALLSGVACFLPQYILIYFLVWLLGALLYFVNFRPMLPVWISLPLFFICFCGVRVSWPGTGFIADAMIGLTFALVINSTAGSARRLPWARFSKKIADFSYSVYLCHVPFLFIALSALYQTAGIGLRSPVTSGLICMAILLAGLAVGWSWLISLATERQTGRIREKLYRMLPGGGRTPQAAVHNASADT
jgi:peptidoglycan/LPS O-acetylase OafA/YrhL